MSADKPDCPDCGGELERVFLVAPAINGVNGGGGSRTTEADACPTGTCPFMKG